MNDKFNKEPEVADVVKKYYSQGGEAERLSTGQWKVEKARTESILKRLLPKASATIVDVGGGAGAYALPLATQGYDVYLIDLVPLHIEQAKEAEKLQPNHPLKACMVGDARKIDLPNSMADAVLLLGPLYHLPDKNDRLKTISEAFRILKPGGLVLGVGISRYASFMNGMIYGMLKDPVFAEIVKKDMLTGQHINPTDKIEYFTTAYYHQPEDLKGEFIESGFKDVNVIGVEGPGWIMPHFDAEWDNRETQQTLMNFLEIMETEPGLLGVSAHIMAIGKK